MEDAKQVAPEVSVSPEPAAEKPTQPPALSVRAAVRAGRFRRRHLLLALFFGGWVIVPLLVSAWYLYAVADDQYASNVGFSVRTEEVASAIELLGGITELSGSSSSDTDILFEFIQSQQMVRLIHERLDLTKIYRNPEDPFFSLGNDTRIEALSRHWRRMVKIFYDNSSGLIEVRVLSFDPDDSQAIALAVFDESSRMINELSAIARADSTRYAEEELVRWQERLKQASQARIAFQNLTQIVDPKADIQGQMSLLNTLNVQLAEASIELELLLDNSSASDPRVQQARNRISVIQKLIDGERDKLSGTGALIGEGEGYSQLLADFEALQMDLEFARQGYLSAQATYDAAKAEAQRKSRYLATYIAPTRAETAEYPRRFVLLAMMGGFLFISWSILTMTYYSLRDRR